MSNLEELVHAWRKCAFHKEPPRYLLHFQEIDIEQAVVQPPDRIFDWIRRQEKELAFRSPSDQPQLAGTLIKQLPISLPVARTKESKFK